MGTSTYQKLSTHRLELLLGLALALLTIFAFAPVCGCDFLNYDDDAYVTGNWNVLGGLSLHDVGWAFTATAPGHWHPLTWLSLQFDMEAFKDRAWGFHLTNLVLHVANVLLLFAGLRWLTGSNARSAAVAALFAVHPLRVESVAWIAERKDVLSTLFWLLTIGAYVRYARGPSWRRYGCVVLFLVLALMSKAMVMTLPCTLLLVDYWPLARWTFRTKSVIRLVGEKVPLFLLSAGGASISLSARPHAVRTQSGISLDLAERLAHAVRNYAGYLGKLFWPADLALYYPVNPDDIAASRVVLSVAVVLVVTLIALWSARTRPYLLVGWLWYLVSLFPVSGVIQLASFVTADRYTYVPSIGLLVALVWGIADLLPRPALARLAAAAILVVVASAALWTRHDLGYWRNSIAAWEHAEQVTPDNYLACTNLGQAYCRVGRLAEAEAQYTRATQLRPDIARAFENLAICQLMRGCNEEAVANYHRALALEPNEPRYRVQLEALETRQP